MALCIRLERPVMVEVEWTLKFRLVETYKLWPVTAEDLVHLLLFLCGVDASDIDNANDAAELSRKFSHSNLYEIYFRTLARTLILNA